MQNIEENKTLNNDNVLMAKRYPRVFITSRMKESEFLKNAQVVWPSGFASQIYDFGRTCITVYFPMRLNMQLSKGEFIKLGFRLGAHELTSDCRVVRSETRLLVVEPMRLAVSQAAKVDAFFNPQYIAEHLYEVPSKDFAPEQTFQKWYHGPMDTNLYVWQDIDGIKRVSLELKDKVYCWTVEGFFSGPSRDTLSYPTEDYAYFTNFLSPIEPVDANSKDVKTFLEFIKLTGIKKVIEELCYGS